MEEIYNYLMNELKIKYGDVIVAGISGGPDSMGLLHLLIRVKKALDIEIVCAHVNHNVRKESADELIFVKNYCLKNNVKFESMTIENYGDDNFENEARSKRYEFFDSLIKKYNAKYLFTAHHGDDLIETIMMRIVRGSSLKGYSGFEKIIDKGDYKIVRPLIPVTKEQIIKYDKLHKIPWVEDITNKQDIHTRNRYRKYILPKLKEEDPNVHEKFYKFSKTLLEYNEYINKIVSTKMRKIYPQDVLNIPLFLEEDTLIQQKIIQNMLEKFYQDDLMLITNQHVNLLMNLISSKKSNSTIYLPNFIKAVKSYDTLVLVNDVPKNNIYEISLESFVNLPNGKNIEVIDSTESNSNYICRLNSQEISLPLTVRNRENGDKLQVKGMLGSKKIKDIFIDSKIPMSERDIWPIVCDSKGNIVWLPGLKKSKYDKQKDENYDIILKYY